MPLDAVLTRLAFSTEFNSYFKLRSLKIVEMAAKQWSTFGNPPKRKCDMLSVDLLKSNNKGPSRFPGPKVKNT